MSENAMSLTANLTTWRHELKSSRRVQGMLILSGLTTAWLLWPSPSNAQRAFRPKNGGTNDTCDLLSDARLSSISALPPLAKLDGSGALPNQSGMHRDLFLFGEPVRLVMENPHPITMAAPVPEDPHIAELRAEEDFFPHSLRYLGHLGSPSAGRFAGFIENEAASTLPVGAALGQGHWRIKSILDDRVEFVNTRFPELRKSMPLEASSRREEA